MSRVKRGTRGIKRRRKVLKLAKGYRGGRGKLFRTAREAVDRALNYAYRDRRTKKRDFRRLWITRINAAAKLNGTSYSNLMGGIRKANILIDRKILAEMAVSDPKGFSEVVALARERIN
jgi:large subunit ribosomal protein L20